MTTPVSKGTVSCVQVDQRDFDQILTNYRLMSARSEKLELQLKALNKVSQFAAQNEAALKIEKKRSKQFESAYISSEAKLSHLIKTLLLNKEERPADVDILESLLGLKTDELYTGGVERDTQVLKGTGRLGGGKEGQRKVDQTTAGGHGKNGERRAGLTDSKDLETDDAPLSPSQLSHMGSTVRPSVPVEPLTKTPADQTLPYKPPLECQFKEDEMRIMDSNPSHLTTEFVEHVTRDKRRLQNIIQEYQDQDPGTWKAYIEYKQYESLVQSLRLDVASLKITNTELQQLLAAKRGNRTDELCTKALELEKTVEKLRKELKSKHTVLECINKEYKRVKEENQGLRLVQGERTNSQEEMVAQYGVLQGEIERLKEQKTELEKECEKYTKVLELVVPPSGHIPDQPYVTSSWSELWDENQKLKRNIENYRHELEQKQKEIQLSQAQFQLFQDDFQALDQEKQSLVRKLEIEKAQLTDTIQRLQFEVDRIQRQFSATHTNYDRLLQDHQNLQEENDYYKRFVPRGPGLEPSSQGTGTYQRFGQATFAGGPWGGNQRAAIEADGASLPPEVEASHKGMSPPPAQKQHSSPPQIGFKDTPIQRGSSQQEVSEGFWECPQCFREFKLSERQKFEEHKKKCVP